MMEMKYTIKENDTVKVLESEFINYHFDKVNGHMFTWGKTKDIDPPYSPFGPFIADIEVTTSCTGVGGKLCKFCYKSNTPNGSNMSFETFKKLFHKIPKVLTQIAFGADATCESNPEIWDMMEYCRTNDYNKVVPNITVADINDDVADKLAKYCGAVAVSRYDDKNFCYDSVKRLTDRGMTQTNIHIMLSVETYDNVLETLNDFKNDDRLEKLNCIVLLSLKQKGRGTNFHQVSTEAFKKIVDLALDVGIPLGFDSCSQPKFEESVRGRENYDELVQLSEPCESTCYSIYISADGKYYPCSFCEQIDGWENGIDVVNCDDFYKDVWYHESTLKFRNKLLSGNRECPVYDI